MKPTFPVISFALLGTILCGKAQYACYSGLHRLISPNHKAQAQVTTVTLFNIIAPTPGPISDQNSVSYSVLGTNSDGATSYLEVIAESLLPVLDASATEFSTVSPTNVVCKP